MEVIGTWFAFWAIGVRLFTAAVRQVIKPDLTSEGILGISGREAWPRHHAHLCSVAASAIANRLASDRECVRPHPPRFARGAAADPGGPGGTGGADGQGRGSAGAWRETAALPAHGAVPRRGPGARRRRAGAAARDLAFAVRRHRSGGAGSARAGPDHRGPPGAGDRARARSGSGARGGPGGLAARGHPDRAGRRRQDDARPRRRRRRRDRRSPAAWWSSSWPTSRRPPGCWPRWPRPSGCPMPGSTAGWASSSRTSPDVGCSWCWTTWSRSSTAPPMSPSWSGTARSSPCS